jgi:mannitol-1-phosphate/altronate dehydrogenase
MRTPVAKLRKYLCLALLVASACAFVSCASEHAQPRLVDDPDAPRYDSAIPWNRQEKWETGAQLSNMINPQQQGQ